MRLTIVLLILASVLAVGCNAASVGPTNLSKAASADLIQSSPADQSHPTTTQFLSVGKSDTETSVVVDEERGKLMNIVKNLKNDLKLNTKLLLDRRILFNFRTFRKWYKSGKTPEDIWKAKNLGPLYKEHYQWGRIGKLKKNRHFRMYLKYEKFYKIMKGTYGKKA
ncbi:hypothetical protein PHYBOEH_008049 [Phytophthora boehmeriae]|uniref:RxLR effector protein n=1 Tax=Phytophthora boehmeriae TaxID=109152 RepID=A0A8T1X1H2_9STRA|nr:hypothetical protein PHYBOEH_008049 [Phytophthora boehmeriae]